VFVNTQPPHQKGPVIPKGAKKSAEEIVKGILEKQKETFRKIQERDREKIKKLNAFLAKEKQEKRAEAKVPLEKVFCVISLSPEIAL